MTAPRLIALYFAAMLAVVVGILGCSKREQEVSTATTYNAMALPLPGIRGDIGYAQVRAAALPALYQNFRDELNSRGLVKWDARFDCNHFASLYIALAQTDFAVKAWHSTTSAQSLALAEVWFIRDRGDSHAIVAAATDRGLLFIEPQSGGEIQLSAAERSRIFLCKW